MAKPHPYDRMSKDVAVDLGYYCQKVERWCAFSRRRIDLYGVIDTLAISELHTLGIQSTSSNSRSAHHNKIIETEGTFRWLQAPHRMLWLMSWSKRKIKRGGTAFRYMFIVDEYYLHNNTVKCNRDVVVNHPKSVYTSEEHSRNT